MCKLALAKKLNSILKLKTGISAYYNRFPDALIQVTNQKAATQLKMFVSVNPQDVLI